MPNPNSPPYPAPERTPSTTPAPQTALSSFTLGTGSTLHTNPLLPALETAKHEVILTTCFWASSPSITFLCSALRRLSASSLSFYGGRKRIKVFICLSSRSLWQKLTHTNSPAGETYAPEAWEGKLGLPSAEELRGLEVRVKSLFFRPWGVLHAKYLIVDRERVLVPSCNVSWEEWFEGCLDMRGEAVREVFEMWKEVWVDLDPEIELGDLEGSKLVEGGGDASLDAEDANSAGLFAEEREHSRHTVTLPSHAMQTTLLPHIPPRSKLAYHIPLPFPFPLLFPSLHPDPPPTPLNTTLLQLFVTAKRSITLLTPNLTSPPVCHALIAALRRGVDVHLVTNRRMMVLEQLLTAGGITEWWVWWLAREHGKLLRRELKRIKAERNREGEAREEVTDLVGRMEEGRLPRKQGRRLGKLSVEYFRPFRFPSFSTPSQRPPPEDVAGAKAVKTHVKLTVVDDEIVVLGSGNMDRASWYASQELGVMLTGREVAAEVWGAVEKALEGRLETYYE